MSDGHKVPSGLKCWKCGTRLNRVFATRYRPGAIVRHRKCPKCGTRNVTTEKLIH